MKSAPLFDWMQKRHWIYVQRFEKNLPPPWTTDKILQQYKFTNVFRQLDRVTIELNKFLPADHPEYLFNLIWMRWFNWPETWKLIGLINNWPKEKRSFIRMCKGWQNGGYQLFTGAYIVTNGGRSCPKLDYYVEMMDVLWKDRDLLSEYIKTMGTLEETWNILKSQPGLGPFTAYEVVTDLRWTWLKNAPDIMTWANPGPGARRGLNRLAGRDLKATVLREQQIREIKKLLDIAGVVRWPSWFPTYDLEMREIEHSLCEFDKYERVRLGQGRPRSRYNGGAQ